MARSVLRMSQRCFAAFATTCVVTAAVTFIEITRRHSKSLEGTRSHSKALETRAHAKSIPHYYYGHDLETNSLNTSLDKRFLLENFDQLKKIVKTLSMSYVSKVDELMVHRLPVIDVSDWHLHRTNGKALTVPAAQQLIADPNHLVPNAAHYILPFADPKLQFHHLVCILSGFWVMRADHVFLWYSEQPRGSNWDLLKWNLSLSGLWETRVVMVKRPVPTQVYKQPVKLPEHQSDVMRMEAMLVFGGVYFDLDVIALKSMAQLRNRSFTIGRELPAKLCNGVFLAAPNSRILALWHVAYQTLDDATWVEHSVMLPNKLCRAFADHCHVEEDSMDRPNFMAHEFALIYGQKRGWDWRKKNYAMHLWYRFHRIQYNIETIKYVDSMLGDMFRYVLYGNSSLFQLPAARNTTTAVF